MTRESDDSAASCIANIPYIMDLLREMYVAGMMRFTELDLVQTESVLRSPDYLSHLPYYYYERSIVFEELFELIIEDDEFAALCEKLADSKDRADLLTRLWDNKLKPHEIRPDQIRWLVEAHALLAVGKPREAAYCLVNHWVHPFRDGSAPTESRGFLGIQARSETLLALNILQKQRPELRDVSARLIANWFPRLGLIGPDVCPSIKEMAESLRKYDLMEPMEGTKGGMPFRLWTCGLIAGIFCDQNEPDRALAILHAATGLSELIPRHEQIKNSIIGKAHAEILSRERSSDSLAVVQRRGWTEAMYLICQVWCAALGKYNQAESTGPGITQGNMIFHFLLHWFTLAERDFQKTPDHLASALCSGASRPLFLNKKTQRHLITLIASAASLSARPQFAAMAFAALATHEGWISEAAWKAQLPQCPPELFELVDQACRLAASSSSTGTSEKVETQTLPVAVITASQQFLSDWSPILLA